MKHKHLEDQVIVITGGSSGIGLVTARAAARRGARVVLAARNERALAEICDDIRAQGGDAIHVVADVGNEADVRRIADTAIGHYGGFDTWVNGAAVSIYGKTYEVDLDEQRRLFETNYWGTVHGSRIALDHLRHRSGALINIGSVLSDRAIPIQGVYSASKHAVKGFTDALRVEVETDRLPISITLIKPSAIDTPYMVHAKNYLDVAPKNPPPIYAPDLVARAILHAAEHGERDIVVGGGGRLTSTLGMMFPRLSDYVMRYTMSYLQRTNEPAGPIEEHNLFHPEKDGQERSLRRDQFVLERSLYTSARLHPVITGAATLGLATAAWMALRRSGASASRPRRLTR